MPYQFQRAEKLAERHPVVHLSALEPSVPANQVTGLPEKFPKRNLYLGIFIYGGIIDMVPRPLVINSADSGSF